MPDIRPRHEERRARIFTEASARLAHTRADVLFFGDSIVERWPDADLQRVFSGRTVLNLGIGGDRVADLAYRLRAALDPESADRGDPGLKNLRSQAPSQVVLLLGTNDLKGATPCYIAQGLVDVVSLLRRLYPRARVTVIGILPRGAPAGRFAGSIAAVNTAIAASARRSGAFQFIDLSAGYGCETQVCDHAVPESYVHPTAHGYAILDTALRAKLGSH